MRERHEVVVARCVLTAALDVWFRTGALALSSSSLAVLFESAEPRSGGQRSAFKKRMEAWTHDIQRSTGRATR